MLTSYVRTEPAADGLAVPATDVLGTILLVEDQPAIARMLIRLFGQAGLRVQWAADPGMGESLAGRYAAEIGLAFVDFHGSERDHSEYCRRLRAIRPDLPVLLAASPVHATPLTGLHADSPTMLLPRPYLPTDIVGKVRELLVRGSAKPWGR